LKNEVKKGAFREDLYYRLCVIPITLPPLRERKGDVKMLIDYFLRIKSFSLNKTIPKIDEKLYTDLISYNWPGNIRQLENYIENIVNLDGRLSFDLWEEGESLNKYDSEALKQEKVLIEENFYAKDIINNEEVFNLEELEVGVIRKAIHVYNNNMTQAAKALGISRNTLYLKIKKYNIEMS
jgi:transcriptional regulator with PAS, ATPase and Fis domain